LAVSPTPVSAATLSMIVPTYNERERLPDLVHALFRAYAEARVDGELVIVDDNSPDGTGEIADDLARQYRITVVHRPGKLGLGTAVVAGFESASASIVGVIDADLSHPPQMAPRMLHVMQRTNADVVIGSRYIPGGGTLNWPVWRKVMSRFGCVLARTLTPVADGASGLFLIRRDLARGVRISAGGFKICLELLVRGRPGLVVEVPYVFSDRAAGQSKMSMKEALGYLKQIRDLRRHQRSQPPYHQPYRRIAPGEFT
jgi:dolichol-phosphate mannosyltransferase